MAQVNTVRGPVEGGRLGRVPMREHIYNPRPILEGGASS